MFLVSRAIKFFSQLKLHYTHQAMSICHSACRVADTTVPACEQAFLQEAKLGVQGGSPRFTGVGRNEPALCRGSVKRFRLFAFCFKSFIVYFRVVKELKSLTEPDLMLSARAPIASQTFPE